MTKPDLRTLCAVLALAVSGAACDRQDNPPNPPKSMVSSQGTSNPDVGRNDPPLPAGTPPAVGAPPTAAAPEAGSTQERGMGGVAGAAAGTSPAPTAGPVAGSDRAFVSEAANSGLAEVEAARLIAARTDNDNVKSLAQHMEREHASTNDELKRIAEGKGIEVPSTIGGEPRGQLSRLTTLSKPEVDRAFVRDFGVEAHQRAITLFERQAREGQDPELKAFAERTLPKLREHLAMAQRMQGGQAGSAGTAGTAR